jgi:hypothetical protein
LPSQGKYTSSNLVGSAIQSMGYGKSGPRSASSLAFLHTASTRCGQSRAAAVRRTTIGGTAAATVNVGTTSGSATLVYQVDSTGGIVTVSPIDITTSSGLASLTTGLAAGAPVRVYGSPQADGTLKAYVLTYFTGQAPVQ